MNTLLFPGQSSARRMNNTKAVCNCIFTKMQRYLQKKVYRCNNIFPNEINADPISCSSCLCQFIVWPLNKWIGTLQSKCNLVNCNEYNVLDCNAQQSGSAQCSTLPHICALCSLVTLVQSAVHSYSFLHSMGTLLHSDLGLGRFFASSADFIIGIE